MTLFGNHSLQAMQDVAARSIAPAADRLMQAEKIPESVWQALMDAGLFGITLPKRFGGHGGDYMQAAELAGLLAEAGDCYGMAMSWLGAQLIPYHFLVQYAGPGLQSAYLPGLAEGRLKIAIGISELKAGAHPKHLTTKAEHREGQFILNGEKAYVTNGPLADLFIIFAITAIADNRKRYTAFVVPRDSAGLSLVPMAEIDFLKPSAHCRVRLENVAVPPDNALLHPGEAYERMALPFRQVEDALGIMVKAGALMALLRKTGPYLPADDAQACGALLCRIDGLKAIGRAAVAALQDSAHENDITTPIGRLTHAALLTGKDIISGLESMVNATGTQDPSIHRRLRDLQKSLSIARTARQLQLQKVGLNWQAQQSAMPASITG